MRATKPVLLSVLAIFGAACFLAAGRAALEVSERTGVAAQLHLWQAPPAPPERVAEQVIDLQPAALEEAEVEAEAEAEELASLVGPEVAPKTNAKTWRRRIIAANVVDEPAVRTEVEPEDAIRMALRSKRASFEHCYEQELKKQASFSGFIVVALSLSASGRVTEARVQEGNRRDAVVGACIVAALRTMKLPPLTSEADLLIPIRLQAREPS